MKKLLFIIIILLIFSFNLFGGKIVFLKGEVQLLQKDRWVTAEENMEVSDTDQIRTGEQSFVEIILNDGSVLKINQVSVISFDKLVIKEQKRSVMINLLTGKLRAIIKKLTDADEYEFRTPTAVCGVRGTDFGLESESDVTSLLVFDGVVEE